MLNLFSVRDKQASDAADKKVNGVKQQPCELRMQKDMGELCLDSQTSIEFPDGKDKSLHFQISLSPVEGMYRGGKFVFDFTVPTAYPHSAPKVKCKTKVYHPNIDLEGNVCLNILREDWKPVLSINHIIYGLQFLFAAPNPDDPLNKDAAKLFSESPKQFEKLVVRSVKQGATINGEHFPPCPA